MYNHAPSHYECSFCAFSKGIETKLNKKSDVVFEDSNLLAFISPKWWINNPGGVVIIPKAHVENVYEISDTDLSEIYILGKRIALAMKSSYICDGISIRQHNEPAGDQDVWHFHLHVLPRYENDLLYQNHDKYRFTNPEERVPFAEKLRSKLK